MDRLKRWALGPSILLCACAPAATAAPWQLWIAAGGGPGGEYSSDGGMIGGELGGRYDRHAVSAHMLWSVGNMLSSSSDATGELSLLYGYQLHGGDLAVDLQAGPALVAAEGDESFRAGLQAGLHLQLRSLQGIGLGLRPVIGVNHRGGYLGALIQLELGKIR